jgi:hypothetical protein
MRRAVLAAVVVLGLIGAMLAGNSRPETVGPFFTQLAPPGAPFVPGGQFVTSTWYCPGTPSTGDDGTSRFGGEVVVANPTDTVVTGRIQVLSVDQPPVLQSFTVGAHDRQQFDTDQMVTSAFASAVVELDGGRGIVEQRAIHPSGNAVASCANATSSNWYFPDGFTVDGSTDKLVLTNPFPAAAIVDVSFSLAGGAREPSTLQGLVVNANSVRVVDLGAEGAQQQNVLAVHVAATSGRVVAGKEQRFIGGGRLGYVMSLGAPSLDSQWWFADGEQGANITEQYVVYNPNDRSVEADLVLLGIDTTQVADSSALSQTVTVPASGVQVITVSGLAGVPPGRHAAVVSTNASDPVVVERVISRPVDDGNGLPSTTAVIGAPSSYIASTWHLPIGVTFPLSQALVVYNTSFDAGTVTVSQVGPGGAVPVPGLENIPVAANGVITLDLTDPATVNSELIVTATTKVVVERRLARGDDESVRGRSGSFAIPEF